ncbi:Rrf2 family transcriptional regulator [Mycoplasma sp. HF14]
MVDVTNKKTVTKYGFTDFISLLHIFIILGHKGELMSSAEIAENLGVNSVKIRIVLKALDEAEWITKIRGRKGGYTLNKPLKDIKCSDLLDILDLGLINKTWTSGQVNSCCVISRNIEAVEQDLIFSLNDLIYKKLQNITLEEIKEQILSKEA